MLTDFIDALPEDKRDAYKAEIAKAQSAGQCGCAKYGFCHR